MIDRQLAQFLQEGLGIHLGTRNQQLEPNGARAVAIKVENDGAHVLIYISRVAASRLLPDLQSNGQAAVTFARPVDERACQVKATFVSSRAARAAEHPFVMQQWEGFLQNLERIGIPRKGTANWVTWPALAIRLRVTALFEQTPGAKAGAQLA